MAADRLSKNAIVAFFNLAKCASRSRTPKCPLEWAIAGICLLAWCASSTAWGADDLDSRRRKIAALSPADQQELLDKQERFLALPAEEQDRLRALQAAVDADPNAERLREVLAGYHEWLKTLSPGERAELIEMPPAERVKYIAKTTRKQAIRRRREESAGSLTRHDMSSVVRWIEDVLWRQRDTLIQEMSPRARAGFGKEDEQRQRRRLVYIAIDRSRHDRGKSRVDIRDDDIQQLANGLSAAAKAELAKQPDFEARRNLIGRWVLSSMYDRSEYGRGSRRAAPLPKSDVARFFDQELTAGQRDELMRKDPREAREELRRLYWRRDHGESVFPNGRPGSRGEGSRSDRRRPDKSRHDGPRPGPPRPSPASRPNDADPPRLPEKKSDDSRKTPAKARAEPAI